MSSCPSPPQALRQTTSKSSNRNTKSALAACLETKIILLKDNRLFFKHELYRRTIEYALSPFMRIKHHRRILTTFCERFECKGETERIIHHAKNANDHPTVVHYAPIAARQAAALGAHTEAAQLYFSAIEYYPGKDPDTLVTLYEPYANECYLTNRMKEAIIYQQKVASIWREKNNPERPRRSPLVPLPPVVVRRQPAASRTLCPGSHQHPGRPTVIQTQGNGLQQHVPAENAVRSNRRMYPLG